MKVVCVYRYGKLDDFVLEEVFLFELKKGEVWVCVVVVGVNFVDSLLFVGKY